MVDEQVELEHDAQDDRDAHDQADAKVHQNGRDDLSCKNQAKAVEKVCAVVCDKDIGALKKQEDDAKRSDNTMLKAYWACDTCSFYNHISSPLCMVCIMAGNAPTHSSWWDLHCASTKHEELHVQREIDAHAENTDDMSYKEVWIKGGALSSNTRRHACADGRNRALLSKVRTGGRRKLPRQTLKRQSQTETDRLFAVALQQKDDKVRKQQMDDDHALALYLQDGVPKTNSDQVCESRTECPIYLLTCQKRDGRLRARRSKRIDRGSSSSSSSTAAVAAATATQSNSTTPPQSKTVL